MGLWFFREKERSEKSRNPMSDEFFSSNSEARALVREAIQNSLDASINSGPIKVRFYLATKEHALDNAVAKEWIDNNAWEHFLSKGSGLANPPRKSDPCPFLVYEDFNTKGLNGDVSQHSVIEGQQNAFYHFLRAEGQSDKFGDKLGSWGVGKIVFPRASLLRSFFVFTTRSEDKKTYLAGQSILKFQQVSDKSFSPDGWFGKKEDDGFGMPEDDSDTIRKFRDTFNLSRVNDEPGLSIVIPWLDECITAQTLAESVISEYFYPILNSDLEVIIETPEKKMELNDNTLLDEVRKIDKSIEQTLVHRVDLAGYFLTHPKEAYITLEKYSGSKPVWQPEMIGNKSANEIRNKLNADDIVVIKAPVEIIRKDGGKEISHLIIVIKKCVEAAQSSTFIRDGLLISEVGSPKARGTYSLVIINDKPLKDLLGNAENPAHTKWEEGSSHYKNKYRYGGDYLRFVRLSVAKIIQFIQKEDEEEDIRVLMDIFSIPSPSSELTKKGSKPGGKKVIPPDIKQSSKKQYYDLEQTKDGFRVRGKDVFIGQRLYIVKMAYDRVRGNPFSKWKAADFDVKKLAVISSNLDQIESSENSIRFMALNNDFELLVSGFDINRDLKIDVRNRVIEDEKL